MFRKCYAALSRRPAAAVAKSALTPLEVLTQIQLGISPPLATQRSFLMEYCETQLERRGVTEAKLIAMDGRLCADLMKQLVYEQYLAVPFRVFSFDMEFTGPPVFTADGPTEDITEIGVYSPLLDETFSCLVQPACGRKQGPGVEELTHISDEMLAREGIPFVEAWGKFLDFVQTPQPDELPGSEERILLLSHGGKLADVSLIKWTLEKFDLELPASFVFGDTIHLIRDAHRRRPVTVDKHPPSWKLGDLVQWLHIPPTLPAHRAGNDARMTWDALYHTLLRYGDDEMTPRQQLIPRFFDEEAKRRMRESTRQRRDTEDALLTDDTFLLADAALAAKSEAQHAIGEEGVTASDRSEEGETAAVPGLMELDFDDIFKKQNAASVGPSPVIKEFKLDDEVVMASDASADAAARERGDDDDEDGAASSSTQQKSQKKPGRRGRKTGAASTATAARVDAGSGAGNDEVFLV